MALVKCKECGQEVSQKAGSCPKCGAPRRKKTSLFTWIATVIAAFGLYLFISALAHYVRSTDPLTQTSSSQGVTTRTYKIGEKAHIGYTSYVVSKVYSKNQLSDNRYQNEAPDATFLFVELAVRNDDTKPRAIAPFKLIDENGSEYQTSSKAWAVDGHIGPLSSLNPEVEKKGIIVFDVPQGKYYRLKLSGGYWSSDEALVELGRLGP